MMPRTVRFISLLALIFGLSILVTTVSMAQEEAAEPTLPEGWLPGPITAELGESVATVEVPDGYAFADGNTTRTLMEAMGNPTDGSEVGLIAPTDEDASWFIVFEHRDVGYVDDTDQDEIDADALFASISEGTEAANEYRREHGGGELHVLDWQIAPRYDAASHNLIWALEAVDEEGTHISNYNVRLLGRRGYMSVTLVTDADALERDRPEVESVLAGFHYTEGNRYADFTSGDKLAGYGLTALVAGAAGAAAVKLGLFAVLAKFFGKAWKLLVVAAVALGAGLKRLFGGRRAPQMPGPQAGP